MLVGFEDKVRFAHKIASRLRVAGYIAHVDEDYGYVGSYRRVAVRTEADSYMVGYVACFESVPFGYFNIHGEDVRLDDAQTVLHTYLA